MKMLFGLATVSAFAAPWIAQAFVTLSDVAAQIPAVSIPGM